MESVAGSCGGRNSRAVPRSRCAVRRAGDRAQYAARPDTVRIGNVDATETRSRDGRRRNGARSSQIEAARRALAEKSAWPTPPGCPATVPPETPITPAMRPPAPPGAALVPGHARRTAAPGHGAGTGAAGGRPCVRLGFLHRAPFGGDQPSRRGRSRDRRGLRGECEARPAMRATVLRRRLRAPKSTNRI